MSKFASLVRAREVLVFPQSQPLVNKCQLDVSPVNYTNSDSKEQISNEQKNDSLWRLLLIRYFESDF